MKSAPIRGFVWHGQAVALDGLPVVNQPLSFIATGKPLKAAACPCHTTARQNCHFSSRTFFTSPPVACTDALENTADDRGTVLYTATAGMALR